MREHEIPKPENQSDRILLFCIAPLSCPEQRPVLSSLQPGELEGVWLAVPVSTSTLWGCNTIKMHESPHVYLNKHVKVKRLQLNPPESYQGCYYYNLAYTRCSFLLLAVLNGNRA
jgi:hypothetical protein